MRRFTKIFAIMMILFTMIVSLCLQSCSAFVEGFKEGYSSSSTTADALEATTFDSKKIVEETGTTTEADNALFGLTEKEIEAIQEIIGKSYVSKPYTLDDISDISRLGYDKMYVNGEWVENTQLIEYKVIFKNGETQTISINRIMLED